MTKHNHPTWTLQLPSPPSRLEVGHGLRGVPGEGVHGIREGLDLALDRSVRILEPRAESLKASRSLSLAQGQHDRHPP